MQFGYFDSYNYTTPEKKRSFLNWALRDNWFYFLSGYMRIVLRTRKEAMRGEYHDKE